MKLDPDSFICNEARLAAARLEARDPEKRSRWRGPTLTVEELLHLHDQRLRWRYDRYTVRNHDTGKEREICAPIDGMKLLSQGIGKQLWEPFRRDLPNCVQAYVKKRSHLTHALAHHRSNEILEIDIQRAFPSVRQVVIAQDLTRYMKGPEAAFIAGLVCIRGRLVQGNPLSPLIFLIVTLGLTQRLGELAEKHELTLSIYADNIVYSGDRIPDGLAEEVSSLLRDEGFSAHPPDDQENQRKNHLMGGSTGFRKIIAGLELKHYELALPLERRRQAKATLKEAFSTAFLQKVPVGVKRRRLRDKVTGGLVYAASVDRRFKRFLEKELSAPSKRQALKRNLGTRRTAQIIGQLEKPNLVWERIAE